LTTDWLSVGDHFMVSFECNCKTSRVVKKRKHRYNVYTRE